MTFPTNWFWIADDSPSGMAWHSAVGAYVASSGADPESTTRILSEAELDEVLRRYGLPSPIVTADDVRAEAARRMRLLVSARDAAHLVQIITNGSREAIRLHEKRLEAVAGSGPPLTSDETARAAVLKATDAALEAIRAASNAMEPSPPADYRDDSHWPAAS